MGKSKVDDELTELLTKLYTMQEDVGAKPKTSDEEKKNKAENIAVMGTGRKAQAKGSRFLELRSMIIQRIKLIHRKLSEVKDLENAGYGGDNATQLIKLQAETREEIRQANDEWKELDAIYKREARKKRSKFTPEELETQAQLVQQLYDQIEKIREAQLAGFARAGRPDHDAAASILGGIKQYGKYMVNANPASPRIYTIARRQLFLELTHLHLSALKLLVLLARRVVAAGMLEEAAAAAPVLP
jgi:hypothetical protein